MSALFSFKLSGRTSASTLGTATGIIASKDVTYDDDGYLSYSDANSIPRRIPISGDLAQLLKELFTGTGGLTAGSSGVQGHRTFSVPSLPQ